MSKKISFAGSASKMTKILPILTAMNITCSGLCADKFNLFLKGTSLLRWNTFFLFYSHIFSNFNVWHLAYYEKIILFSYFPLTFKISYSSPESFIDRIS